MSSSVASSKPRALARELEYVVLVAAVVSVAALVVVLLVVEAVSCCVYVMGGRGEAMGEEGAGERGGGGGEGEGEGGRGRRVLCGVVVREVAVSVFWGGALDGNNPAGVAVSDDRYPLELTADILGRWNDSEGLL